MKKTKTGMKTLIFSFILCAFSPSLFASSGGSFSKDSSEEEIIKIMILIHKVDIAIVEADLTIKQAKVNWPDQTKAKTIKERNLVLRKMDKILREIDRTIMNVEQALWDVEDVNLDRMHMEGKYSWFDISKLVDEEERLHDEVHRLMDEELLFEDKRKKRAGELAENLLHLLETHRIP